MSHPLLQEITQKLDNLIHLVREIQVSTKTYYSLDEAARYLGVSKSTLYKHTSNGDIAYYKPNGKLISFIKEDLDRWINRNRIPANNEL